MDSFDDKIQVLRAKLLRIADLVQSLKRQNHELVSENQALKTELEKKSSELSAMEENCRRLKMTVALIGDSAEKKETEIRIRKMLREVDKCIALLNR